MAKIHTVEWTPAILAHPTIKVALNANWWGLVGEKLTKMLGRISKNSEAISGIPGSGVDQNDVPYSLTEEFVAVYRLHSLIPGNVFIPCKPSKIIDPTNFLNQMTLPSSLSPLVHINAPSPSKTWPFPTRKTFSTMTPASPMPSSPLV